MDILVNRNGKKYSTGLRPLPWSPLSIPHLGVACWPRRVKHLSFNRRMFHAAPSDLMGEGSFDPDPIDQGQQHYVLP